VFARRPLKGPKNAIFIVHGDLVVWPWPSNSSEWGTKHIFSVNLAQIHSTVPEIFHKRTRNLKQQQPFYGPLSGTTWVSRYQKKHSPIHHPDHHSSFISFFHLLRSVAFSLFKLRAWQSFCTTSLHVFFGLPLGLEPSTSYSINFFTQSFRNTMMVAQPNIGGILCESSVI